MDILHNAEEWGEYRNRIGDYHPDLVLDWPDPKEYPCLVAAKVDTRVEEVQVCFTYITDAIALAQAHGLEIVSDLKPRVQIPTVTPTQKDFDVSVTAHLLTLVSYLVETQTCSKAEYETRYARTLGRLEQQNMKQAQHYLDELERLGGKEHGPE